MENLFLLLAPIIFSGFIVFNIYAFIASIRGKRIYDNVPRIVWIIVAPMGIFLGVTLLIAFLSIFVSYPVPPE